MKPRIYIETSVISYLAARPSLDAINAARQTLNQLDLIASWNFRHIASIWAKKKISDCLIQLGVSVPLIATPEDIMESLQ